MMSLLLKKNNVPTPKTYCFFFRRRSKGKSRQKLDFPLVLKPVIGSWGRGVMPLKDKDTTDAMFELRELTDGPHDRIFYLQELVKRPPRDIRVITSRKIKPSLECIENQMEVLKQTLH